MILPKDISVLSCSDVSCCSRSFAILRARLDGMHLKRNTTSNDMKTSSGSSECWRILSAMDLLFLTVYLLFCNGERIPTRSLDGLYVEEPIELVLGRRERWAWCAVGAVKPVVLFWLELFLVVIVCCC